MARSARFPGKLRFEHQDPDRSTVNCLATGLNTVAFIRSLIIHLRVNAQNDAMLHLIFISLQDDEALVQLLDAFGVRHIFGLCGDTSLPFYDAMHRLDHDITHVLTRDERHATYMADAYARVSKRVGVCEGPSGGGATYILPGLVEANDSSIPVLAITTDVSVAALGNKMERCG
jgi:hypothetical protein